MSLKTTKMSLKSLNSLLVIPVKLIFCKSMPSLSYIYFAVPELWWLQCSIDRQFKVSLFTCLGVKRVKFHLCNPKKALPWPERRIMTFRFRFPPLAQSWIEQPHLWFRDSPWRLALLYVRHGHCVRGLRCENGLRTRRYHILSGSVLSVWTNVERAVSSRMQIIRLRTDDAKKIVGTLITRLIIINNNNNNNNAVLLHDTLPATDCTDWWAVPICVLSKFLNFLGNISTEGLKKK